MKGGVPSYRVAVVGLGKIGLPLAALYASRGCRVLGCDVDQRVVERINSGQCTIDEPGLQQLIVEGRSAGSLYATGDTTGAVQQSNVVVIIVPLLIDGKNRPEFRQLISAVGSIADGLQPGTLVLLETTVPVGTTRHRLLPLLERSGLQVGCDVQLAHSPERVSSGTVFQDLVRYPKIVGGIDLRSTTSAVNFYKSALGCDVLALDSTESAEFTKLVETTYRDVNIALANEYARYAADRGLDVMEAIMAANTQPFSHVHTPGIGVGGHCIPVYPYFLINDSHELVLPVAARAVNSRMPEWSAAMLEKELRGLVGRRILVLGYAYRGDVAEHAFTPAAPLVAALKDRGAHVLVNDPLCVDEEIAACGAEPVSVDRLPSVEAVVIQAWHRVYERLDFAQISGCSLVLDGRNRLSPGERNGVRYFGVGRGQRQG